MNESRPAPPVPRRPTTGSPRTEPAPARLSKRSRKIALTVHIATSVSWLGSAYVTLVVGLAAALSVDPAFRLGGYEVIALLNRAANIPLAFLMLVTGFLLALGTRWGLIRHRWILVKLALSVLVILANQRLTVPDVAAAIAALRADVDLGSLPVQIVGSATATVALLSTVVAIAVAKPWGRTRWGITK